MATSSNPADSFKKTKLVAEEWGIDPTVLIDDDGRAYLYCHLKVGDLNEDMASVKEETIVELVDVEKIPYKGYEGPFVFKWHHK